MSPFSWPVVGGAVLVGSPALWAALVDHTLSPDVAVLRVALCGIGVWLVLSVVVSLATGAADATARAAAATSVGVEGEEVPGQISGQVSGQISGQISGQVFGQVAGGPDQR